MRTKTKKGISSWLLTVGALLALPATLFAASTQITYTLSQSLPGITSTVTGDAAGYISGIFEILIGIAGVLAVVVLVIAGIEYIGGASNPQVRSDAKARIIGALIGLLIALGSYLILNSINTNLVATGFNLDPVRSNIAVAPPAGPGPQCLAVQNAVSYVITESCYLSIDNCMDAAVNYKNTGFKLLFGGCYNSGDYVVDEEYCKLVDAGGGYPVEQCGFIGNAECTAATPPAVLVPGGCYRKMDGYPVFSVDATLTYPPPSTDTLNLPADPTLRFKINECLELEELWESSLNIVVNNPCTYDTLKTPRY